MVSNKRVIIERSDTGAQASVIEADFKKHYPDVKYRVLGGETPAAFVATVPRAPQRAGARRKTTKTSRPAKRPASTPGTGAAEAPAATTDDEG